MEFDSAGRLLAACVVIGIVLYGLRAIARASRGAAPLAGPARRIVAVLETTMLPGATSLHVVRVAERYYLIGRGAAQPTTLCEIAPESIAASRTESASTAGLHGQMGRWIARFRAAPGSAASLG